MLMHTPISYYCNSDLPKTPTNMGTIVHTKVAEIEITTPGEIKEFLFRVPTHIKQCVGIRTPVLTKLNTTAEHIAAIGMLNIVDCITAPVEYWKVPQSSKKTFDEFIRQNQPFKAVYN